MGVEGFLPQIFLRREEVYQPTPIGPERIRKERYFTTFALPGELIDSLSENQRIILFNVLRAADLGERIFASQVGDGERPNFYPRDATKREIMAAAHRDPAIDDHYTVVVRDQSTSNLVARPFHQHYPEIRDMAEYLRKAANAAANGKERDPQLQVYLRAMATAFTRGDYEPVAKYWLQRSDEPKIDIVLGFYDANTDTILGRKFAFEFWINILSSKDTQESQDFTDRLLDQWRQKTGQEPSPVRARVGYDIAIAGQADKYGWTGNNLPSQPAWREKYGSKFTVFMSVFEDNLPEKFNMFRSVIDPSRRIGITNEFIKRVALRMLIAHEVSHSLGIKEGFDKRLREHASWVKELYCDLLALDGYSQLEGVGSREIEIALATLLAFGRLEYNIFKRGGNRKEYSVGSSILLKHLLDSGATSISRGRLTWNNTNQFIAVARELLNPVRTLLQEGKVKDAELFLQNNFDPEIYSRVLYEDSNLKPFYIPEGDTSFPGQN